MQALLIGNMERMEALYHCLEASNEIFEINTVVAEDKKSSEVFVCEIKEVSDLKQMELNYDIYFVCSKAENNYKRILSMLGVEKDRIMSDVQIQKTLSQASVMERYKKDIRENRTGKYNNANILIGDFTYGKPRIFSFGDGTKAVIGKFCSIGPDVTIMLGGEHRTDWCTTYPFNALMREFSYIKGHPHLKGDVKIGNDVWIGSGAKIMSGVTIGDGSVIAANACVTKNVEPYTIVGGVPAKKIKSRFDDDIVEKFMEMKWWDWDYELIYEAVPLLQSNSFEKLYEFYRKNVLEKRRG